MRVHGDAATSRKQRLDIMGSDLSRRHLAERHGVAPTTAHCWKGRDAPPGRGSRPKAVRVPAERGWEESALALGRSGLTLDGVLSALREGLSRLVRSTLRRHLQRNDLGRSPRAERETKAFKAYEPGFVHVDATAGDRAHRPAHGLRPGGSVKKDARRVVRRLLPGDMGQLRPTPVVVVYCRGERRPSRPLRLSPSVRRFAGQESGGRAL